MIIKRKICKQCNKEFEAINERPIHPAIFCGRKCFFESRKLTSRNFDSLNKSIIPLTQGEFAIIDPEDFDRVSKLTWHLLDQKIISKYAITNIKINGKNTTMRMHRFIMNAHESIKYDHINGNGLDNRKSNLRVCTPSQNTMNAPPQRNGTSKFKGVFWDNQKNKWACKIKFNGKSIHIGFYNNEIDAAKAYDLNAIEYFKNFARPNFNRCYYENPSGYSIKYQSLFPELYQSQSHQPGQDNAA